MLTFSDLRGERRPTRDLPLFDMPARVRTFDTPEFHGVTFYEVEAKSLLNRVPAASRMPFEWSLNVYRGCSHACSYCLFGDTPILMADGRTRPLAEIRTGDAVCGTVAVGTRRRYVTTRVLDHWQTVKPAYRVRLADGTELISSGDHRFLTDTGWRQVSGCGPGGHDGPRLTAEATLVGTGGFATPPRAEPRYQRGYLYGLTRGQRFGSALVDIEAVRRVRTYLAELEGAEHAEVNLAQAMGATGPAREPARTGAATTGPGAGGRTGAPPGPAVAGAAWDKGFLAGVFDAAGTCGGGVVHLYTADQGDLDRITGGLRRFGFSCAVDSAALPGPGGRVRLLGGLGEQLRFLHTVDPAITRKRTVEGQPIEPDARLRVVSIEPLGVELPLFDLTTTTGDFIAGGVVSHNCFARPSHTYLNFNAGSDFDRKVVVKVNAAQVLRRELRRPSWTGAHVAMGTNTDPYQRCEGRYRLTRAVLEVLRDFGNPCSVLTKSPLLTRDLDLMTELAETAGFSANLSIGTLDEQVWRRSEPGTPHPRARIAAVRRLRRAGISCGVLIAPILPGISDSPAQLQQVVRAAAEAGADHLAPITLHLRRGVKEEFMPWLERAYPELVADYRHLYRGANAPRAVQDAIVDRVETARRRHPISPLPAAAAREPRPDAKAATGRAGRPAAPSATQLSLPLE